MRQIRERKPKKHYHIILHGEYVGESWAVSTAKAINNFWWRAVKSEDQMTPRFYDPSEFDAVEI
jgi:hypothetical protein